VVNAVKLAKVQILREKRPAVVIGGCQDRNPIDDMRFASGLKWLTNADVYS